MHEEEAARGHSRQHPKAADGVPGVVIRTDPIVRADSGALAASCAMIDDLVAAARTVEEPSAPPTHRTDTRDGANGRPQCEAIARAVLGEPMGHAGAELLWRCPNHQDEHPSLSVNPKKNLWLCGPCGMGGTPWKLAAFLAKLSPDDKPAVKAYLQKVGVWKDVGKLRAKSAATGRGPVVATYVYCDVNGNPVVRKLRHEPGSAGRPKDFEWQRWEAGEWVSGLGRVTPPLYRLPEIQKLESVIVVEGCKDADNGARIGLPTTTSGGTGSWKPQHAESLRGKRVVIIPDGDPPGQRHALTVAASLCGKAASLKVLKLPGAKDLSEWLEHGGTAEGLRCLTDAAPEWKPPTIELGALLDKIVTHLRRYVVMTEAQARVEALWVAHTHAFEAANTTPYLAVNSPEKQSGKTLLEEVCELLVANPWLTGRVTAAVLIRKIDAEHSTLLLDESDAAFGSEKEYAEALRGLLNTGHRRGGKASLCVGQGANITYKDFSTFCPKMIAGIGRLPDTVADRSFPIRLKRAAKGERRERFRRCKVEPLAEPLRQELEKWAIIYTPRLSEANPTLPEELSDRQQDGAEPLLAIADLAGGDWPEKARASLVALCTGEAAKDRSIGVELLADIRTIFFPLDGDGKPLEPLERISSEALAKVLAEMKDRVWAEWGKAQKPMSQAQLAKMLRRYEIEPRGLRLSSNKRLRGYEREWFEEVWKSYLPPYTALPGCDTVTTRTNTRGNGNFQGVTPEPYHTPENAVSANKDAGCHGGTPHPPLRGRKRGWPSPQRAKAWVLRTRKGMPRPGRNRYEYRRRSRNLAGRACPPWHPNRTWTGRQTKAIRQGGKAGGAT